MSPDHLDDDRTLHVTGRIQIPRSEFSFEFIRSSGPGGQNVNKVASKARLRWDVVASPSVPDDVKQRFLGRYRTRVTEEGELILTSQRFRDQPKNEADCYEKVREMLLSVATPPVKRRATKPSRGSKERRLKAKKEGAAKKQGRRAPRLDADS
jgi:ribosome-associated protein